MAVDRQKCPSYTLQMRKINSSQVFLTFLANVWGCCLFVHYGATKQKMGLLN